MKAFILAALLALSGCSTIEYYLDDAKLQSLQDRVEAKIDQLEADWDAKTAGNKADLKEKLGTIHDKIDKYRESSDHQTYKQILELIDKL